MNELDFPNGERFAAPASDASEFTNLHCQDIRLIQVLQHHTPHPKWLPALALCDATDTGRPRVDQDLEASEQGSLKKAGFAQETNRDSLTASALKTLARQIIDDKERFASFEIHIDEFAKRAHTEKLPLIEQEEYFGQVGKVLQGAKDGGNRRFTSVEMQTIALEGVRHGARPQSVNQGSYSTCAAAALEAALYKAEPATIAKLVADVSLDGSYTTSDETKVKLLTRNLKPDKYNHDEPNCKRSSANQIAQLTLLNIFWNRQDGVEGLTQLGSSKKGAIRYEEGFPKDHIGDDQVRLMDYSADPPKPITYEEHITDPLTKMEGAVLFAQVSRPVDSPLMSIGRIRDIYDQLRGNQQRLQFIAFERENKVDSPKSLADFRKMLASNVKDGRLLQPIILGMHANIEPFKSDLLSLSGSQHDKEKAENLARMHAQHAVSIFDYQPDTGLVSIDNQWGESADHLDLAGGHAAIPVDVLYESYINHQATSEPKKEEPADKSELFDKVIEQQRRFVSEIESDDDQQPGKVVAERKQLYQYIRHWKGTEAAASVVADMASDVRKLTMCKQTDFGSKADTVSKIVPLLKEFALNDELKQILMQLNSSYQSSKVDWNSSRIVNNSIDLIRLHKLAGDEDGATNVASNLLVDLEKGRSQPDERWLYGRSSVRALSQLNELGQEQVSSAIAAQIFSEAENTAREGNSTNDHVLTAKLLLFELCDALKDTQRMKGLIADLERITNEKDISKELDLSLYSTALCTLRDHYLENRQQEKLKVVIPQILQNIAQRRITDEAVDADARSILIGPLQMHSRIYANSGMVKESIQLAEEAYSIIQQTNDKSEQHNVAETLIRLYQLDGRHEAADKLAKENGAT